MSPRRAAAMASAAVATARRSSRAAVSRMAPVPPAMICCSTVSSGCSDRVARPGSVAQPLSPARPSRSSAYPGKPTAGQNRVTVAGDVPLRSARSTIVARAAAPGSLSTCSATRSRAPVNSGSRSRIRTRTLSGSARLTSTSVMNSSLPKARGKSTDGWSDFKLLSADQADQPGHQPQVGVADREQERGHTQVRQPGGPAFPAQPADQHEPADQAEQREQAARDHQYQDEPDKLPELAVPPVRDRPGRPAQERDDRAEPAPPAAPLEDLDLLVHRGTRPAWRRFARGHRGRVGTAPRLLRDHRRPSPPCAGRPAARTSMASRSTQAGSSRVSGRSPGRSASGASSAERNPGWLDSSGCAAGDRPPLARGSAPVTRKYATEPSPCTS